MYGAGAEQEDLQWEEWASLHCSSDRLLLGGLLKGFLSWFGWRLPLLHFLAEFLQREPWTQELRSSQEKHQTFLSSVKCL